MSGMGQLRPSPHHRECPDSPAADVRQMVQPTRWANSGLSHRKMSGRDRKRPGGFAMRIDLKKVNAEMTDLRSKLAAIDNDLDECRRRHFEHPRARSQIRRGAPLSGIVCSVASRNLPSLASAPAGDHWGLVLCCRSALSPARASGPPKGSNISSRRTRRSGPTAR